MAGAVPRQAMVLAAGFGERLRPLTDDRAKPSLPLMNRPLVVHTLDALERAGVGRAVINLHHLPSSLEEAVAAGRPAALPVTFSAEPVILGTGGGVQAGLAHLEPRDPLLILNGDSFSDLDLSFLARRHEESVARFDAPATLAVRPLRPGDPFTPVYLDGEGAICGIGRWGREGAPHVFMGVHILQPGMTGERPPGTPWDLVRDFYIPRLEAGERLGAAVHDGWWIEIGSPRLYLAAHMKMLEKRAFLAALPPSAGRLLDGRDRLFAAPEMAVPAGASVSRSVLGPGCRLAEDCMVSGTLMGSGVGVGPGARVEECILWDGVEVAAGEALSGSLLWGEGDALRVEPLA